MKQPITKFSEEDINERLKTGKLISHEEFVRRVKASRNQKKNSDKGWTNRSFTPYPAKFR